MRWFQTARLSGFVLLLAAGQILFKRAAETAPPLHGLAALPALALNLYIWAAVALYGAATLLWIFLLQREPLSRAYPFVALRFVVVPALAWLLLNEEITPFYLAGTALVLAGIWLTRS
ncbi:MAG: EamA family transporter [Pseudomonadota bacterium]